MSDSERNSLLERVEKALDAVRPYLNQDGGNVILREITDDRIAKVELTGACINCAFSYQTLKAGIEMSVKSLVPEINSVESLN